MKLIRLYAWSCVIALPVVLSAGILYLYIEDRVGSATAIAGIFAVVCICVTAIILRDRHQDSDHEVWRKV